MEVLFQDSKSWRLVARNDGTNKSSIQHCCRPDRGVEGWWYYCNMLSCGVCSRLIPDELRGLKALHNWER